MTPLWLYFTLSLRMCCRVFLDTSQLVQVYTAARLWTDTLQSAMSAIHLYRLLYFTLKTVSSENVSSCQLVKFHLHTASTLSIRTGERCTNGQENPGELLPVFVRAAGSSLEIYSTRRLCYDWSSSVC